MNSNRRFPVHPEASEIYRICTARMNELYGEHAKDEIHQQGLNYFSNRLENELASIKANGFETAYWVAMRIAEKARERGYPVQPRGCVGSSFVAYLLGITGINPLQPHYLCPKCKWFILMPNSGSGYNLKDKWCPKCGGNMKGDGHDIPFEFFAGLDGDKMPDIDINVAYECWEQAYEDLKSLFPDDMVVRAGSRNKKGEQGVHPGGWFIIPKEFADSVPTVQINIGGKLYTVTQQPFNELDKIYLKLDILNHNTPTVLSRLSAETGIQLDDIPMNDRKVMAMFTNEETGDISEFRTDRAKRIINIYKPSNFSDLVTISGLMHGSGVWEDNAEQLIKIGETTPQGVLAVREDVYQFLLFCMKRIKGKIRPKRCPQIHFDNPEDKDIREEAYRIMETTRIGRADSDIRESDLDKYNLPVWFYNYICKIKYMFPKAHVVSYVKAAVQMAWFKVYHKELFDEIVSDSLSDDVL